MNPELERELDLLGKTVDDRHAASGWTGKQLVYLTRGDGTGQLTVTNGQPREIWVRRNDNTDPFPVFMPHVSPYPYADGDTTLESVEVIVGYPDGSQQLTLKVDSTSAAGQQAMGNTTPMEAYTFAAFNNVLARFLTLQITSLGTSAVGVQATGPVAYINPATGYLQYFDGTISALLATQVAALAAGKHQLAVISLDTSSTTPATALVATTNTASTASSGPPARDDFATADWQAITNDPSFPSYYLPLAVVYLYKDQPYIVTADDILWDLRPFLSDGRSSLPRAPFAQTASVTVASTASETTLVGAGAGSATIPANAWYVGKTIRVRVSGYLSDTGTPTLTVKIKFGSTVILTTGAITLASGVSNVGWQIEGTITCRTVGGSGTVFAQGTFQYNNSVPTNIVNTAAVTIDTTASQAVSATATWSASSASNTITATNLSIEAVN
jgi:hypothetical protein